MFLAYTEEFSCHNRWTLHTFMIISEVATSSLYFRAIHIAAFDTEPFLVSDIDEPIINPSVQRSSWT